MKNVLFIHSASNVGGIETFFIRLAKDLAARNIRTNFLFLYKGLTNEYIDQQLKMVANVYCWDDICKYNFFSNDKARLLLPLDKNTVSKLFDSIDCLHVDTALTYLCAKRIISCLNKNVGVVFGVYHINELSWNFNKIIPFYEFFFRKMFFSENALIIFFNEASSSFTKIKNSAPILNEVLFPIGIDLPLVVNKKAILADRCSISICSVGRLVEFKKYNKYMIGVVKQLIEAGVQLTYDVYGDGPLKNELIESVSMQGLQGIINYKGTIEYSDIDKIISAYDLFIGSGTSLLQASANGVPSIIAIENESLPITYGFFSKIPGIDYHEQKLPYPKIEITEIILEFNSMLSDERQVLSADHLRKVASFGMSECTNNFLKAFNATPLIKGGSMEFYIYIFGFMVSELMAYCFNKPRYSQKYDQLL